MGSLKQGLLTVCLITGSSLLVTIYLFGPVGVPVGIVINMMIFFLLDLERNREKDILAKREHGSFSSASFNDVPKMISSPAFTHAVDKFYQRRVEEEKRAQILEKRTSDNFGWSPAVEIVGSSSN